MSLTSGGDVIGTAPGSCLCLPFGWLRLQPGSSHVVADVVADVMPAAQASSPAVGRHVPSNSAGKALGLSHVGFPEPVMVGMRYSPHIGQAWLTGSLLEPGVWPAPPEGEGEREEVPQGTPPQRRYQKHEECPPALPERPPLSGNCSELRMILSCTQLTPALNPTMSTASSCADTLFWSPHRGFSGILKVYTDRSL